MRPSAHLRFPRPRRVAVTYGGPITSTSCVRKKDLLQSRLKEIYQQVADEITVAIAELEPCGQVGVSAGGRRGGRRTIP